MSEAVGCEFCTSGDIDGDGELDLLVSGGFPSDRWLAGGWKRVGPGSTTGFSASNGLDITFGL